MIVTESETFTLREALLENLDEPDDEPCISCSGSGCRWCDGEGNARGLKRVIRAELATMRTREDAMTLRPNRERTYDMSSVSVMVDFKRLNEIPL